jgi:hypothetical protein
VLDRCGVKGDEAGTGGKTDPDDRSGVLMIGLSKNSFPYGEAGALLKTSLPKIWSTNWRLLICPSQI